MKSVAAHITSVLAFDVQEQTQKDIDARSWVFIDNKLREDWTIFDVRTIITHSFREKNEIRQA